MARWKDIKGYEGLYQVSDEGQVLSLPRTKTSWYRTYTTKPKILKPGLRGNEGLKYQFVILDRGGEPKHVSVHRLVAEAFIDNPDNLPEVNHIDKNPLNNRVENLEWCTKEYNIGYSKNKGVKQFTEEGRLVGEYPNMRIASEATGIGRSNIANVLAGLARTAGGYVWAR